MTLQDAMRVLIREGFLSYFGPEYSTTDAVHSFMSKYPRGKGLKQGMKREIKLYEACLAYKQNRSRTKKYVKST